MQFERIALTPSNPRSAPPILFVHGAWHGAWCWEPYFLPYFAEKGFAVEAFSLRAHGESDGQQHTRGLRFKDYVADLTAICQSYEQPPLLIGHSTGGVIVQKYLETHNAPAAVMLASLPPDPILGASFGLLSQYPGALLQSLPTFSLKPFVASPQRVRKLFFSANMPLAKVTPFQSQMQDESVLLLLDLALARQVDPVKLRTTNPEMPMLVLGAANDSLLQPALMRSMAQHYGTTAQFIPEVAHDMMLEEHWQDVADVIIGWIQAHVLKAGA